MENQLGEHDGLEGNLGFRFQGHVDMQGLRQLCCILCQSYQISVDIVSMLAITPHACQVLQHPLWIADTCGFHVFLCQRRNMLDFCGLNLPQAHCSCKYWPKREGLLEAIFAGSVVSCSAWAAAIFVASHPFVFC